MEGSLKRRAMSMGAANAVDYALQFIVPAVLARFLDPVQFGEYRLFWLAVASISALTTFAIPQSMYYFMPRTEPENRRVYIYQALIFLLASGIFGASLLTPWNGFLPGNMRGLFHYGLPVFAFIILWVPAYLVDMLPMAEERARWQVGTIFSLVLVRSGILIFAAILTRDLRWVLWGQLAFVSFKMGLLLYYLGRHHRFSFGGMTRATMLDQLRYALPFGLAGMMYGWRAQADQWVAALLFSTAQFGAFSVASVLTPLVNLFRQSVNQAFLPNMNKLHANGQSEDMLSLNGRANVAVALFLYPALAFSFAFADHLITLIYTNAYAAAAPVMRIYIVGLVALVIEINSIMMVLRQGRFAMFINAGVLAVSVLASLAGARLAGLPGAALGSVTAIYLERVLVIRRVLKVTGKPLAAFQDWATLFRILIASGAAAALGWLIMNRLALTPSHLAQVAVAAAIYLPLTLLALQAAGLTTLLRRIAGRP